MARVNEDKLNQFVGRMLGDMGAALGAALVLVGDRLGRLDESAGIGVWTRPAELVFQAVAGPLAGHFDQAERRDR